MSTITSVLAAVSHYHPHQQYEDHQHCPHLPLPGAESLLPGAPPDLWRPGTGGDTRGGGCPPAAPVRCAGSRGGGATGQPYFWRGQRWL